MSVPVWGTTLSGPLPVVGLVSRYLTNYLMGRSPLLSPHKFGHRSLGPVTSCGISCRFQQLSPASGQVSYVLRTRSPLTLLRMSVRLACIRHAASVHPEPGSNSPLINCLPERRLTSTDALAGFDTLSCLFAVLAFLRYAAVKERTLTRQKTASSLATGFSGQFAQVT